MADQGARKMSIPKQDMTQHELSIGIVGADSKLHFASKTKREPGQKSRWRALDWLLGTHLGQFLGLCLVAICLIVFGALIWMTTGGNADYNESWGQALWFSWGMFFDPGTQMGFAADESFHFKFVAVIFSFSGFIYNLIFLGLIVDIVRNLLEHWRLQRSRVVANGHTLLLGWTQKSLFLIEELKKCFENQDQPFHLVILADEDSLQIKREISRHFPDWSRGRNIHVRCGSPFECNDLERVSAKSANGIIVLSGAGSAEAVDRVTVRSVIALAALSQQPSCPIVSEVRAPETSQAIRVILDTAEGIYARDAVCRVMCLKAVLPVVGDVFEQMMSWSGGSEIYVRSLAELKVAGCSTLGEAQRQIPRGTVIGVRPQDEISKLALPEGYKLKPNDHLLLLADSVADLGRRSTDSSIVKALNSWTESQEEVGCSKVSLSPADIRRSNLSEARKMTIIIVGWPSDVHSMLLALKDYLMPGSKVIFFSSLSEADREQILTQDAHEHRKHLNISNEKVGSTTSVSALATLPLNEADAVIVVADQEHASDPTAADSASLQSAISLDGLLRGRYKNMFEPNDSKPRLICEVMSAATERALKSAQTSASESLIQYFHSGALETGLFTIASTLTPVFNAMLMLLQRNRFGDIVTEAVESLLDLEEKGAESLKMEEVMRRVRNRDDVLLGVVRPTDKIAAVLPPHKLQGVVEAGTLLILVSHRHVDYCNKDSSCVTSQVASMAARV